ncbi:MAG: hypothetical protein AAB902_02350 [Patescibacteria group bacterium]
MNNKNLTILALILTFLGGFLFFYRSGPTKELVPVVNQANQQTTTKQNWESKTDEQSAITVTVTPIDIFPRSKQWKFDISMNTHSIELDQDLTKTTVLVDNQGKEYRPIAWEGPVGGHHREGVLVFNAINPLPKYIELKIKNIGSSVTERLFKWDL